MVLIGIIGVGIGIGGGYFGFRFQNVERELADAKLSLENLEDLQRNSEALLAERDSLATRVQQLVQEAENLTTNETQSAVMNRRLEGRISILESRLEEIPVLIAQLEDRNLQFLDKEQMIEALNQMVDDLNEEVAGVERELANVLRKQGNLVPDLGFSLLFEESFEYIDSISNNGWIPVSIAGKEETQSFLSSDKNNALRLDENSSTTGFEYHFPFVLIESDFRFEYYVRIGSFSDEFGLDLRGSEGVADGVRGISTGFNGVNFVVQNRVYFDYGRDQWYHIRFDVNMTEKSMDVYVDDMDTPIDTELSLADSYYDRIVIRTSAIGVGVTFWDGIRFQTPEPVREVFSPEGTVIYVDSFEYSDAPSNHGWDIHQMVGSLQTQRGVSVDGSRALEFSDTSDNTPLDISHSFPELSGDFQVDYHLRTTDRHLNVLLLLDDGGGDVPRGGRGILTELTDGPSGTFRVQNAFTEKYNLNQWYHVRLIVRPSERNFDVFLDDMSNPLLTGVEFEISFFNRIRIMTGTGGTGLGYWDGIVIQGLESNSTSRLWEKLIGMEGVFIGDERFSCPGGWVFANDHPAGPGNEWARISGVNDEGRYVGFRSSGGRNGWNLEELECMIKPPYDWIFSGGVAFIRERTGEFEFISHLTEAQAKWYPQLNEILESEFRTFCQINEHPPCNSRRTKELPVNTESEFDLMLILMDHDLMKKNPDADGLWFDVDVNREGRLDRTFNSIVELNGRLYGIHFIMVWDLVQ